MDALNIDLAKARRESIRWLILRALDYGRPMPVHEAMLLSITQAIYSDSTPHELRREMDYLADRDLIKIDRKPDGVWWADMTRYGVDVAEYTIECEPGIARPRKG